MRDWVRNTSHVFNYPTTLCENTSPGIVKFLKENPALISPKHLSSNSAAIDLLFEPNLKYLTKNADLETILYNKHPDALKHILPRKNNTRYMNALCRNPNPAAVAILREKIKNDKDKNSKIIDWNAINTNPCPDAIQLLRENMRFINVFYLCLNPAPEAVALIDEIYGKWIEYKYAVSFQSDENTDIDTLTKIFRLINNFMSSDIVYCINQMDETDWQYIWSEMCAHPAGLKYVMKHGKPISLKHLSANPCPEAIKILSENMFDPEIDWYSLSANPGAIDLLEQVFMQLYDKYGGYASDHYRNNSEPAPTIYWSNLMKNPAIFTYDYDKMHGPSGRAQLHANLIAELWNPERVAAFLEAGCDIDQLDEDELPPHKARLQCV